VDVESKHDAIQEGDVLLLCCDGLSGMVPDPQMLAIVQRAPDLEHATAGLVNEANRAGGVDNITVILIRCDEVDGRPGQT
jgi:protein phosphatase